VMRVLALEPHLVSRKGLAQFRDAKPPRPSGYFRTMGLKALPPASAAHRLRALADEQRT
jgi:hypothetical protein